ncbi:hypothetical protein INT47_004625 [Mucor saturninus]|uniref:Uncharacterized protein n=1 Tax=Mucor saturninus TaxID=64648 RepID=A0A8H7RJY2_9FUNG|nr:hypothetical protein INT47_004625 [Mucor saturninus]
MLLPSSTSSNAYRQRDRLSREASKCDSCSMILNSYHQLQTNKRFHIRTTTSEDTDTQESNYDYAYNGDVISTPVGMDVDDQINYNCGCSFEENEGRVHVYQASRISSNIFTKAELMSIHLSQLMLQHTIARAAYRYIVRFVNTVIRNHDEIMLEPGAKISYSEVLDDLVKAKSSVHGHEYDVCPNGYRLYGLDDEEDLCIDCDENQYKTTILPGPKKPTHLDSFLRPIIDELKDSETHGLVVKRGVIDICGSKIYLLLASGDIPAVADMAHIGSHSSTYNCRFCKSKGRSPDNKSHGKYFDDSSAPLRPLQDYMTGNPIKNIYQPSVFRELLTFSGSSFFGLSELHLIARGIGKHLYDLITVEISKDQKHYYTKPDKTVSIANYHFYISRNNLDVIGDCITSSRKHVPVSFQGSFDNVFEKIDATRAVDWSAKNNVLGLVKGRTLALQWDLTPDLIREMEGYFETWQIDLLKQVNLKNISRSVFRPVQHYLIHVPYIIKQQGPLRSYTGRSMERVIGVYSKLIESRRMGGRNASMLIERFAIRNFINGIIDITREIDLIAPARPGDIDFMDLPDSLDDVQLWAPFGGNASLDGELIEGIRYGRVKDALSRYYRRSSGLNAATFGDFEIAIASRA